VTLTTGPVAVVPEIALIEAALDARLLPHLADLGHAELRVGPEEQLSRLDGEVVLLPVPKILELLVVNCREGVHAGGEDGMNGRWPFVHWFCNVSVEVYCVYAVIHAKLKSNFLR